MLASEADANAVAEQKMRKIRFRLIHLLIVMTIICISISSYFWFNEYQHNKRAERLVILSKEISLVKHEFDEAFGTGERVPPNWPTPAKRKDWKKYWNGLRSSRQK